MPASIGYYRWFICALLFAATTVNYIDRQILGILAKTLETKIGWSETQYGWIVAAFQTAYAVGLVGFGKLGDALGLRLSYALAVAWWSVSAMLHAVARTPLGFGLARLSLGLGEGGNFPAAVKTIAEWFPRKERALAVGLFNCGSNVGAVLTPLAVPWITHKWGWQWAFVVTGAVGFLWLVAWLVMYRSPESHPRVSRAELDHIQGDRDAPVPPVPWLRLLKYRQTWALVIARFLTDPVWWFYLYWAAKYLQEKHGLSLTQVSLPLVVIYLGADGGSVFGGWLSSSMIRRGWSVNAARKLAILACALLVVPMAFASRIAGLWSVVTVLALATAAHQGWSANMFASISDMFPRHAVSSVTGIAGFGGSVGGILASTVIGHILDKTHNYAPMFLWASVAYLVVLGLIHVMIPKIEPIGRE